MLSINRVYLPDAPSVNFEGFKTLLKRIWLRTSLFSDRMAVARLSSELANTGHYNEARIAIQHIDKCHAAKIRLLRRLSN